MWMSSARLVEVAQKIAARCGLSLSSYGHVSFSETKVCSCLSVLNVFPEHFAINAEKWPTLSWHKYVMARLCAKSECSTVQTMPWAFGKYPRCREATGREIPARVESDTFQINIAVAVTCDVGKGPVTMAMLPCFHQLIVRHKAQRERLLAQFAYWTSIVCARPILRGTK